jgi:hypothetical protein
MSKQNQLIRHVTLILDVEWLDIKSRWHAEEGQLGVFGMEEEPKGPHHTTVDTRFAKGLRILPSRSRDVTAALLLCKKVQLMHRNGKGREDILVMIGKVEATFDRLLRYFCGLCLALGTLLAVWTPASDT